MEARKDQISRHFSHEHPLELTGSSPHQTAATCSGCRLDVLPNIDFYHCKSCRFSLHKVCSEMPRQIQHPSNPIPSHSLVLNLSASPKNSINCTACGGEINGFHYNCGTCSVSLHTLCSFLPTFVSVASHPHPLQLEFSLHYEFSCNICCKPGSSVEWLYRCNLCEFNSHLGCAASNRRGPAADGELMQLVENTTKTRENPKSSPGRTALASPDLDLSQQEDNSALISIDLAPTPSHQFSETCFSIDLQKSYNANYQAEVRGMSLPTRETKEGIRLGIAKQEKKQSDQETERGSSKTKGVTIKEEVFAKWGSGNQMERSKSHSREGYSSKTAKPTLWKNQLCCYLPRG